MKNTFLVVAILFLSFLKAQPLENALLWKISGNGLTKPSYLFGTIHISCDVTLDENVKTAMEQTQQLYLEIDLDDAAVQTAMMQQMMMKNGTRMSDLCTPEDYALVEKFIQEKLGMPLQMFNTVKPIFVSMMLIPSFLDCQMQSVEQELVQLGAAQNEEVFGLETVDEQIAALDAMPYKEQMAELVESAKSVNAIDKEEIEKLFAAYKTKDIEGMLRLSKESDSPISSKYETQLLTNRNQNWIGKIRNVSFKKPTLFAVGAAHLAGDLGVIKLLRKAGYTVEAVN